MSTTRVSVSYQTPGLILNHTSEHGIKSTAPLSDLQQVQDVQRPTTHSLHDLQQHLMITNKTIAVKIRDNQS